MSTLMTSSGSSSDRSLELAMNAMSAERSNRPRKLVIFASILLVVAVAYLLWSVMLSGSAAVRLKKARTEYRNLEAMAQQLRANVDPASTELYRAVPPSSVSNKLQTLGDSVGLPGVQSITAADIRTVSLKGYVQKQFTVNLLERDPNQLFQWLGRVISDPEIPGMDIYRIKLTPGYKLPSGVVGWNLEVTFKRWQKES